MIIILKKRLFKKDISNIRQELLHIRFSKAQRKNFSPAKYKKTRKLLAQSLTKQNLLFKKEKENTL